MTDVVQVDRASAAYPPNLELFLGDSSPETVWALGDMSILDRGLTALFCSQSCPGDLASQAYDVAQHLRDAGRTVASGFHSPMEKETLKILLSSPHPVVIGFGRSLDHARLPQDYQRPLQENRLLVLSLFGPDIDRVTQDTARMRNLFLAALADQVFVAHAGPGSRTERFCQTVLAWGKPLFTLDSSRNGAIIDMGARPVQPTDVRDTLS